MICRLRKLAKWLCPIKVWVKALVSERRPTLAERFCVAKLLTIRLAVSGQVILTRSKSAMPPDIFPVLRQCLLSLVATSETPLAFKFGQTF